MNPAVRDSRARSCQSGPVTTTPAAGRDRFADLLRTAALGAVILGHWTMAAVRTDDAGEVRVGNVLSVAPALWPVTWVLVLIPLFFLVGGFSNATSLARARARGAASGAWVRARLGGLLRPVVPFVLLVLAAVGAALAAGAPRELVLTVAVVLLMPMWFVVVYAVLAALTPTMLRLDARFGARVPVAMALGAIGVDAVRIVSDQPFAGYLNYVLVWGLAQQLGFAYRDGRLLRLPRRTVAVGFVLALLAMAAAAASPWWAESMVGTAGQRSPMNPPSTLAMLHVLVQTAAVLLLRPALVHHLDGPRLAPVLDRAAALSMRAFLWHLPVAVVLIGGWLAAGLPLPEPGSATWWWTRPPYLAALGAALWLVLLAGDRLRPASRGARRERQAERAG